MIKSRKLQLVMVLISVCACGLTLGAEPNEAETELKIEISDQPPRPPFRVNLQPPFESTHVAVLFVRGDWEIYQRGTGEAMLETSAGRAMSQKQRELISDQSIRSDFGRTIPNYTYFRLFGVSEDDTKKMVEAFIEILTEKADARMQEYKKLLNETKEKISKIIKKELPEKLKQFKAAESKYKEVKNARYSSLGEAEALEKAKETMLQMDKMLDVLEIELAGIQEKLNSIEKYRQRKYAEDAKNFSRETLDKLDQMFVEQMIELSSAKARQKAALRIRNREKAFLDLFSQWSSLNSEVHLLNDNLNNSENNLRDVEKILVKTKAEMLPPKIYQNKVTIYPVR